MLEWIISASALTALVLILRRILKGKISLRLQYALWAIVLLRLLIPVSFGETILSIGNLSKKAAETEEAQLVSVLTQLRLPRMSYSAAYDQVAEEYAERGVDVEKMTTEEFEQVDYEIQARMAGEWSFRQILGALWLLGMGLVGAVLLASNVRFALRLRRTRRRLEGVESRLPVYVSPALETPCLFGLFRPAVYVTPAAAADAAALRHVVEHELTHFRHGDHIWPLLRGLCLMLHWYNPLVWLAAARSRDDAELACDEAVIRRLGESERAAYGRTLIGMTCRKRPELLRCSTTMTGSQSSIKERILILAKRPKTAVYTLAALLLLVLIAVGCTFTGAKEDVETPPVGGGTEEISPSPDTVGAAEPKELNVVEAMKAVRAEDFTNPDYYGNISAQTLAKALNAAAENQITEEEALTAYAGGIVEGVYSFWSIENAYLEGGQEGGGWSGTDRHFRIDCGLAENIVHVYLREDNAGEDAYFRDEDLYRLVRHKDDYDEMVDAAAYEKFKDILVPKMESAFEQMAKSDEEYTGHEVFTNYELTRFTLIWTYKDPDDSTVELYDFHYALLTDDPLSVVWAGGMWLDSKLRVQGFYDGAGCRFAVKYQNGEVAAATFMGEFFYSPEDTANVDWAKEKINAALDEE